MTDVKWDDRGLVPGIVQDAATGTVLMLGYLNEDSLARTRESGLVHFWSRSRGELWQKGATSGNALHVVDIAVDCDGDALLITAHPAGPTCHTGAESCFDGRAEGGAAANRYQPTASGSGFGQLEALWNVIVDRRDKRPEGSYTVQLLDGGVDDCARKIVEESAEVVLAAKNHSIGTDDDRRVAEEVADLVYHLLVLLAERGVEPAQVMDILARRAQ